MANPTPLVMIYEGGPLTQLTTHLYEHMRRFGYQHTQVPAIAEADVFLNKAGDQIAANLLTFDRFGQQLALRPEFTALAALRYAQRYPQGNQTVRWQFNGSVFLDNYSQRTQNYQHMTVGAELFGMTDKVYADAEILHMAITGLTQIAELPDVNIQLGHLGLIQSLVDLYKLDDRVKRFIFDEVGNLANGTITVNEVLDKFDRFITHPIVEEATGTENSAEASAILDTMLDATQSGSTMGGRTRQDITRRLIKKRQRTTQRSQLSDALSHLNEWLAIEGTADEALSKLRNTVDNQASSVEREIDRLEQTLALTAKMGTSLSLVSLKPGLVRSWNYYTGMTFEMVTAADKHIGGGGRYDDLVQFIGPSANVPAVGFVYDVSAILEQQLPSQNNSSMPIVFMGENIHHSDAVRMVQMLRDASMSVSVVSAEASHTVDGQTTLSWVDGNIHYNNRVYTINQADALIRDLQQNGSSQ